jgi:SAM-dependent methyltransferase
MSIKTKLACALRPHNKSAFVASLPTEASLFDIGCGNRSAERIKRVKPHLRYVGIDVGDFLQSDESLSLMDRYLRVPSMDFASAIGNIGEDFDAVISAHNIEHCEQPEEVLDAMCAALKSGGWLYFSFPCLASVGFPKRSGTLNFYDDPTHREPPDFFKLQNQLVKNGMTIGISLPRSRPLIYATIGALMEPVSALRRSVDDYGFSWAFWGFESIIWAQKK